MSLDRFFYSGVTLLSVVAFIHLAAIVECIFRHRQAKQGRHDELVRFRQDRPDMYHEEVQMSVVPGQTIPLVISSPRPAVTHGVNGSVEKGSGRD